MKEAMIAADDERGSLELIVETVVDDWMDRFARHYYGSAAAKDLKLSLIQQLRLLGGWDGE